MTRGVDGISRRARVRRMQVNAGISSIQSAIRVCTVAARFGDVYRAGCGLLYAVRRVTDED